MRTSIIIVLYDERDAGKTYWSWTTVVRHLTHIVSSWYHTEPDSVHRGAALAMHTDSHHAVTLIHSQQSAQPFQTLSHSQ